MADSLVYVSTGSGRHVDEMRFSILSATSWGLPESGPRVVVYCDDESRFQGLPVETVLVDDARLKRWLAGRDYLYRIKICALQDELGRPEVERAVLLDGDTWFKRSPIDLIAAVAPGRTLMHALEGWPFEPEETGLRRILAQALPPLREQLAAQFRGRRLSWNSGVVAMHASDAALLDEVLHINDLLYDTGFGSAFHTAEQIAFAVCLDRRTRLREARRFVEHYWLEDVRRPFDEALAAAGLDSADETHAREAFDRLWDRRPELGRFHFGRRSYLESRLAKWGVRL